MNNFIAIKSFSRKFLDSPWFFPLLLLAVCLVAYGIDIRAMGFYYDDWPAIFLAKFKDPAIFWSWFALDRPFSAWTYLLSVPVLGANSFAWQLFTIALRWLTVTGFWWTLRQVWPRRQHEVGWMALLMAVYPGFMQQSIAVAYSQHLICYALFTCSLGLMVFGIRTPKWFWIGTILSVIASVVQMLTMEYFVGLELIRPMLIWFLVRDSKDKIQVSISKTLRNWAPYLLSIGIFLVYRLVFFNRLSTDPLRNAPVLLNMLVQAPAAAIQQLLQNGLQDFMTANVFAWANTLSIDSLILNSQTNLHAWVIGLAVAAVIAIYVIFMKAKEEVAAASQDHFVAQGIILGISGFVLGGLPVWMIGNQISAGTFADRYTLAPMFGSIILLVSLIAWFGAGKTRQGIFLAVLFGLAMAFQIRTVYAYHDNWITQRNYYWQMVWRMPALKPGTALMSAKTPFNLVADYGIGFAVNLIYDPAPAAEQVPYWFFTAYNHLHKAIPDFAPGLPIAYKIRNIHFNGSTSQSLVIDNNNQAACIKVVTGKDSLSPSINKDDIALLEISNPDQIIDAPVDTVRLASIFGAEPPHTWCYYFEKADLASQFGDWQGVIKLYEQASSKGYAPKDGTEWTPFIEAFAQTGDWNQAALLTSKANEKTDKMEPYLCATWQRIETTSPQSPNKDKVISDIYAELKCTDP